MRIELVQTWKIAPNFGGDTSSVWPVTKNKLLKRRYDVGSHYSEPFRLGCVFAASGAQSYFNFSIKTSFHMKVTLWRWMRQSATLNNVTIVCFIFAHFRNAVWPKYILYPDGWANEKTLGTRLRYLLLKCNLHEVYRSISNIKITLAVCEFRSFNIRYLQLMLRIFSGEILKLK